MKVDRVLCSGQCVVQSGFFKYDVDASSWAPFGVLSLSPQAIHVHNGESSSSRALPDRPLNGSDNVETSRSCSAPLLIRLAPSQPRCIPLPAAASVVVAVPSADSLLRQSDIPPHEDLHHQHRQQSQEGFDRQVVNLLAYITPDIRWHQQSVWMQQQQQQQQQQPQIDRPQAASGGVGDDAPLNVREPLASGYGGCGGGGRLQTAGGTLSLEAVLLGRRYPIALRFNDGDDAAFQNSILSSTGGSTAGGGLFPSKSGICRSEETDLEGLQAVTLEVDLSGGSGGDDDAAAWGTASSSAGGGGVVISPGMLRINVWCSWGYDADTEHIGNNNGLGESFSVDAADDVNPLQAAHKVAHCSDVARHVSLPDILMASEQVVLLPSQWAAGASDLSSALRDEQLSLSSDLLAADLDVSVRACFGSNPPPRPCRRSKALVDVALVVEAVFATEELQSDDDDDGGSRSSSSAGGWGSRRRRRLDSSDASSSAVKKMYVLTEDARADL